MTGYELSRNFFNFSFEKKECKAIHAGLFYWIVELNNRLGWKEEFGLPTHDTMEGLSIGNKGTYYKTLRELEEWGFIKILSLAKNQFQSCVITICRVKSEPALYTALDTALSQHCTSTIHGTVPIDKQSNQETIKQENNEVAIAPLPEPKRKINVFTPPTLEEVISYFDEKGFTAEGAKKAFGYYESADWHDSNGKKVKNWKQKMFANWFKDDFKKPQTKTSQRTPFVHPEVLMAREIQKEREDKALLSNKQ